MTDLNATPPPAPDRDLDLPKSVKIVELDGRQIYLVGTAHVSHQSVRDVEETIEKVQPDTVCVELCQSRYENIRNPDRWKQTDVVKIIREKKAGLLLSSLIMTSFQKRIAKQLGITPGAEMIAAMDAAQESKTPIILADRDIQTTLKRTWAKLGFIDKMKMLTQLIGSLFVSAEIDEKTIEEIKGDEKLADVLQMLADEFPLVKGVLIDERDKYLAQKIRDTTGERVVAVVGAGHVPGMLQNIRTDSSLDPLIRIPEPPLWPRLLKWGIPALIVGFFAYGFYTGGSDESLGSLYIWVLINGGLSALGAALALGHPITIVCAFLAAPLTSLNPLVAAGWVSGLVQAVIKRPTVQNLEDLPEDILSVRGFWRNPVSRVLLVVVLSNLGSSLGTFISGSWIAARSIS